MTLSTLGKLQGQNIVMTLICTYTTASFLAGAEVVLELLIRTRLTTKLSSKSLFKNANYHHQVLPHKATCMLENGQTDIFKGHYFFCL